MSVWEDGVLVQFMSVCEDECRTVYVCVGAGYVCV